MAVLYMMHFLAHRDQGIPQETIEDPSHKGKSTKIEVPLCHCLME